MTEQEPPSIDIVLDEVRRKLDFQFGQIDGFNTKSGIVLGFAGDMMETRGAVLLMENANRLYVFNYEMDDVYWWHHAEDVQKFEELKQRFQVS